MKKSEDTLSKETISDITVEMMNDPVDGKEFTLAYLMAKFLSSVGRTLYYARQKAGLTQEQVAQRMNTKQPAIARLEADQNGSMTFHRYAEFAVACGMMPRSLMIEPILESIDALRDEMIARAEAQRSQELPYTKQSNSIQAITGTWLVGNATSGANRAPLSYQAVKAAIETAQNIVSQSHQQSRGDGTTNAGCLTSAASQLTTSDKKWEFAYA